jgi:hypothetical protein
MTEDMRKALGNVLDRWEQLPNDVRSDPGFDELEQAMQKLWHAAQHQVNWA